MIVLTALMLLFLDPRRLFLIDQYIVIFEVLLDHEIAQALLHYFGFQFRLIY